MDNITYIAHRINTIPELKQVPRNYGIEFDVRDSNGELLITHDPFTIGPIFEEYIRHFRHRFMIINVKSEGIEFRIIQLLEKYNITNYFFLDCSFPMIWKLSNLSLDVFPNCIACKQ